MSTKSFCVSSEISCQHFYHLRVLTHWVNSFVLSILMTHDGEQNNRAIKALCKPSVGLCIMSSVAVLCNCVIKTNSLLIALNSPEIVDQPGLDVFGQVYNQWKNKECVCPNCSRSIAASRFAPHLEKCLGMGRNSSRIANRRYESKTSNPERSLNKFKLIAGSLQ